MAYVDSDIISFLKGMGHDRGLHFGDGTWEVSRGTQSINQKLSWLINCPDSRNITFRTGYKQADEHVDIAREPWTLKSAGIPAVN